jgi:hypothetical protein
MLLAEVWVEAPRGTKGLGGKDLNYDGITCIRHILKPSLLCITQMGGAFAGNYKNIKQV